MCAAVALACAGGGVPARELPGDLIAIVYRTDEEARQRAEQLERARGGPADDSLTRPGVASVDGLGRTLGALLGASGELPSAAASVQAPEPWEGRLALLDPRTLEVVPVASARRGAAPLDWSADGERLLFSQLREGRPQLYELHLASGDVRPLTRGPRAHPAGCYGPGGRLVTMSVDLEERPWRSVIRLAARGASPELDLSPGPSDGSPSCAPDGSAVAWVSQEPAGASRIALRAPLVEGGARVLTPGRSPRFSRDGRWIVYSAPVRGGWKLARIRPDGTGRARIGRGPLDELDPSVSPDGRLVAYVSGNELRRNLHLRRFDGSGDRILLTGGVGVRPVW